MQTNFPILASVIETYYRCIKVGDSEAWLGVDLITAILRPFTAGEDAVALWIVAQDETTLLDLVPLADGRDFVVLERKHLSQTRSQAIVESQRFLSGMLLTLPTQHVSSDTPTRF